MTWEGTDWGYETTVLMIAKIMMSVRITRNNTIHVSSTELTAAATLGDFLLNMNNGKTITEPISANAKGYTKADQKDW